MKKILKALINTALAVSGLILIAPQAKSQTTCQPPQPGEFILLIVSQSPQQQEQVRSVMPPGARVNICNYSNNMVMRVGGFTSRGMATDWSNYVQNTLKIPAYVVSRDISSSPQFPGNPSPSYPQPSIPNYNPQRLPPGYAVLVDYHNRPEVAQQLKQMIGRQVGLVSYGQHPYILVTYTNDHNAAAVTLKTLSDRGFLTLLVESGRVILLKNTIP
jgi:hypothetical protein